MADHAMRQWDAGASLAEIAQEIGIEIKTAQGLLDDAEYWKDRLTGS
ncbi:hypothetical protein [Pseudophaeobacter sp.]